MRPLQSRGMYVTFLGAVVRRLGGWTPIAATVELMGELGIDSANVRTSVSRLKGRGWLKPETRGKTRGYVLTPGALEELAAGDEVIWHARENAVLADGWCMVNFSVPEAARSRRHQLRTCLGRLGFGNVGAGVWIAPAMRLPALTKALADLGLAELTSVFVGHYADGQDVRSIVASAWDIDDLNLAYRDFAVRHGLSVSRLTSTRVAGPETFATYMSVVDHWRRLPFRDPALPVEVLGADWAGPEAAAVFERIVGLVEEPALVHAALHWPRVRSG